jgi:hypothetical protein
MSHDAQLTPDNVRAIRTAAALKDANYAAIGREYGISRSAVGQVLRRKIGAAVSDDPEHDAKLTAYRAEVAAHPHLQEGDDAIFNPDWRNDPDDLANVPRSRGGFAPDAPDRAPSISNT